MEDFTEVSSDNREKMYMQCNHCLATEDAVNGILTHLFKKKKRVFPHEPTCSLFVERPVN